MPIMGELNAQCLTIEVNISYADVEREVGNIHQSLTIDWIATGWHLAVIAQPQGEKLTLGTVGPAQVKLLLIEAEVG